MSELLIISCRRTRGQRLVPNFVIGPNYKCAICGERLQVSPDAIARLLHPNAVTLCNPCAQEIAGARPELIDRVELLAAAKEGMNNPLVNPNDKRFVEQMRAAGKVKDSDN
jgi:hypothetical protein